MTDNKFRLTDEIINNARTSISNLVDNLISLKMDDIESYNFPLDQKFGLEVILGQRHKYCMDDRRFRTLVH